MHCSAVFVIVALGLTCAVAQRISSGGCPKVQVKSDFELSKYTGLWHEIEKNPVPFEAGLKCVSATYEDEGDYIDIINRGIKISTGGEQSTGGKATIPDSKVPAKLKVKFEYMPVKGDYWILDTDYDNYSIVYSCYSAFKLFKTEFLWILSRQTTLDEANKEKAYKILDDNKVSRKGLKPTIQDCGKIV